MKITCDMAKDLLLLYAEGITSDKTKEAVAAHLKECKECNSAYQKLSQPPQSHVLPRNAFKQAIKKEKLNWGHGVMILSIVFASIACLFMLLKVSTFWTPISMLLVMSSSSEIVMDTDINHYRRYIGPDAVGTYRNKWSMDESIFPEEITDEMHVTNYKMVYYNPWDAQYLSYLIVEYDKEAYITEQKRLSACPQEEYLGYYGAEGFSDEYELAAMYSDPYNGFVYALTDGDDTVIYVELIFCNYFMDLDYENYIDRKYLPLGFDASMNNPYSQKMKDKTRF